MAVIIQQLAGNQYGSYFYPAVSGVAQSHDFYPVMDMRAAEGIAHIALGVGKTVVEGGKSLWFSPAKPKKTVQFSRVENMLKLGQAGMGGEVELGGTVLTLSDSSGYIFDEKGIDLKTTL